MRFSCLFAATINRRALSSLLYLNSPKVRQFHSTSIPDFYLKATMSAQKKVAIVGSGNWGSAIARIVGVTTKENEKIFDADVKMWVYEEEVEGGKLSEIINSKHENVKYLPGKKLPENVRAVTDLVETCKDADILIFVVPHQFVHRICDQLKGKLEKTPIAISLIKGVAVGEGGGIHLISEIIQTELSIDVAVLMGANLAPEVASENFCEATIGTKDVQGMGVVLKKLFHTNYFRINVVKDAHTVELCGALKNVVACAAGFSDGLSFGDNTKAAIIRLGLMEIIRYVEKFYPGSSFKTFFESCGIADLVTTCYGGRNRKICEAFAKTGKTIAQLEKELLNGQSAQGPPTAAELYETLVKDNVTNEFPLFVAVHKICIGEIPASNLIDCIRDHPEHHQEPHMY